MRRALFILLLLPIAAQAQRVTTRTISLGTTAIPLPIGVFIEGAYEWQASRALGVSTAVGYSLRTAGLSFGTESIGEYYSRLSTADVRLGLSLHDFSATHTYPHLDVGATMSIRVAQTDVNYGHADIDRVFPMLYLGAGIRQPINDANCIGLSGRIEVSPTSHNSAANAFVGVIGWLTRL